MDPLVITAASGLRSRMESLDMLANNIANSETSGYKTDREFYSLYTSEEAFAPGASDPYTLPVIEKNYTDFSQGILRATANPLDLAIQGKGFFAVNTQSGVAYTRNGNFQISARGELVTGDGYPVRDEMGKAVQLDPAAPISVAADGTITQSGQIVTKLALVDFKDPGTLLKQGNTMFRPADPGEKPDAASGVIQQGKLEGANVGSPESAVRLVTVMRQFEMLQKAINLAGEMNRKSIDEVARVGP